MNLIKECARVWRRDALRVTRVAAVPLHGVESNADGVALHLELHQGEQLRLEVPRAQAGELRDWLRKTLQALDHWDAIAREKQQFEPVRPPRADFRYRDGSPVRWDRQMQEGWKFW